MVPGTTCDPQPVLKERWKRPRYKKFRSVSAAAPLRVHLECCPNYKSERFKKYYSHPVKWRMKPGLLIFWLRFGSVTGFFRTCSFAKALPKNQNSRLRMAIVFFKPL
jgi:hypothetical protein